MLLEQSVPDGKKSKYEDTFPEELVRTHGLQKLIYCIFFRIRDRISPQNISFV